MSEVRMAMSLPLDIDGCLRRECPYCKREFKVFFSGEENQTSGKDVLELICPYCGQSADKSSWWTTEQLRYAKEVAFKKVLEPELDKLGRTLERASKGSLIKIKMERLPSKTPKIPEEADDMKLFELRCCNERIKIEENWKDDVHCIICGKRIKID